MRIIKAPLCAGALSKRGGVEKGANAVESHLKDFYVNEAGFAPSFEVEALELDNSNLEECHEKIYSAAETALKKQGFPLIIGGDHSLTHPAFKAFVRQNPGAGLIVFDAHPDCQDMQNPPTHEDYLRVLIEDGTLDAERVALIGARNMSAEEKKFLSDRKIKSYSMKEISLEGMREVCDSVMSVARQWPKAYLSIDIDVLDSAFAPGTGYSEPGGLTTRELIYFVQRLKLLRNLGMADLVEVNPEKDVADMTSKAAAKVIVELA